MKDFIKGMSAIVLALLILPAFTLVFTHQKSPEDIPASALTVSEPPKYALINQVTLLDTVKGSTFTLSVEDYLLYSLLAHQIDEAEDELIKAQTAVFYTYILTRRIEETEAPTPHLMGADISTDSSEYLSIRSPTPEEAELVARLKPLITEVLGAYIAYKNEPIDPAFCISTGGDSQSALTVCGTDYPYLRVADSPYDKGYTTLTAYTKAEVFARLSTAGQGYDLYTDPKDWISVSSANPDGYIKEILLDGRYTLTGRELARILNLPSAKFSVSYSEETGMFTFTTLGQGHLVGLSLVGANEMARQGFNWQEILTHYYTDVKIITP